MTTGRINQVAITYPGRANVQFTQPVSCSAMQASKKVVLITPCHTPNELQFHRFVWSLPELVIYHPFWHRAHVSTSYLFIVGPRKSRCVRPQYLGHTQQNFGKNAHLSPGLPSTVLPVIATQRVGRALVLLLSVCTA